MKKRAFSMMMAAAMAATLCIGSCGAYATEADTDTMEAAEAENEALDEAEDMPGVDEGFFVAGFFADSVTTYYKDADTVSDIVSGIDGMEFAAGTAASEDIAGCIEADADLVAAVTYDAEDVDFEAEGEYDIVYRVFVSVEDLQDYLEADEDEGTVDIESDYIDICIPGTVTITEADGEAETEEAETEDTEGVTVAPHEGAWIEIEVNEMTWTYEQATSIPDVVSGIGSIEYDAEETEDAVDADEVYFDADPEIADAVLYDESRVDAEDPDAEDVAYFTYFDREALLAYMDEADIDIEEYPGLAEATTEHIMVYYGPLTELDLAGVLEGVVDHYVLQGAENIDYEYGVTYDGTVVTDVTADAGGVDLTKPGTYTVKYTVTVDTKALDEAVNDADTEETAEEDADADAEEPADDTEEAADDEGFSEDTENADGTDSNLTDVVIEKEVTVVTPEEADKLVDEGKTVWTDDNEEYGKTEEAAADTVTKESTEVASNDTKADTADSSSAADTGSTSSGSGSSGNAGSGSSSSSSGSGSSGSSSGETQHVHDWQPVYHEEQGHYESVKVKDAYDERVCVGGAYVCNNCGYATSDGADITDHILFGGPGGGYCGTGSCHTEDYYETVHHDAVYEDRYVVDQAAYTSYVCSGCGATK